MRIGERTEVELPGAPIDPQLAAATPLTCAAPVPCADGSTTFVLSSWEGNTWLTVDDARTVETRRWLDGDVLIMARAISRVALVWFAADPPPQTETRNREGDAPVTCKRVLRWVRCPDPTTVTHSGC